MAEHKIQHFLPQSYLKGFTKSEKSPIGIKQDLVWVYEVEKKQLKQRPPHKIAWKSYYYSVKNQNGEYDHSLELEFSKMESEIKKLFIKIDNDIEILIKGSKEKLNMIMPDDKELLITFIFLMLKRVPTLMEQVNNELVNFAKELESKYKDYNLKMSDEEIKRKSLWVINQMGLSEKYNIPQNFIKKNLLISYIPNKKTSFITTDNPLTRWRKEGPAGFAFDDTEIYFPISHRCLLSLYGSGGRIGIKKLNDRKHVYSLNKYIARFSKELIISKDKELITKICNELNLEIIH